MDEARGRFIVPAGLVGLLAVVVTVAALPTPLRAEDPGHRRQWFPSGSLYDPYLAEINRPGMGVTVVGVDESGIEGAGRLRLGLKLGGRFGLVRVAPPEGEPGRRWQLGLGAGFYGQFDLENSLDNIGWDGLYSLVLTSAPTLQSGPAFKVGMQHWSSHVGDELMERTGRERIGYTREEVVLGVSWPVVGSGTEPGRRLRIYAEAAYGTSGNAEDPAGVGIQEPGRVQIGVEHEAPESVGATGRWGWYAAFDANSYEERNWEVDLSLGAGLLIPAADRRWRIGALLYDGRTPVGEFFQIDQRYAILGVWLDLERPAHRP